MIRFSCPHCEAPLKVKDERAGQQINCPKCGQVTSVPEALSLDDEGPGAEPSERPRRKVPVLAWVAVSVILLALVAVGIGVAVVLSGSGDGLTRAERAELESKMRRDLPGDWEEVYLSHRVVYTFTAEGHFKATSYEGTKKIGGHVGTWSVSGSRMTLQVTESANDHVKTGRPFGMSISEVKSEEGKVFKFKLSRSGSVIESRTLTRLVEQPKAAPQPKPATQPPDRPVQFSEADLATGKYLEGTWYSESGGTIWKWTFRFAEYEIEVLNRTSGARVGTAKGEFYVQGSLQMTITQSTIPGVTPQTVKGFQLADVEPDAFTLVPESTGGTRTRLVRKK